MFLYLQVLINKKKQQQQYKLTTQTYKKWD